MSRRLENKHIYTSSKESQIYKDDMLHVFARICTELPYSADARICTEEVQLDFSIHIVARLCMEAS